MFLFQQSFADDAAESGAVFFDLNQQLSSDDDGGAEWGEPANLDEDVSSQPVVPFVGMTFDDVDEAQKLYNEYAFKMGFGTRVASSKNSRKRGQEKVVINKTFECIHAGKTIDTSAATTSRSGSASTAQASATEISTGNNSRQAGSAMQMSDTRKINRVLRHNCKAHMIVSLQQGPLEPGNDDLEAGHSY